MARRFSSLWLLVALLPPLSAQTPFLIVFEKGENRTAIANGSTVVLSATRIGGEDSGTLQFTYRGSLTARVSGLELIGAADFTLADAPTLPKSLVSGQSLSVGLRFKAGSGRSAAGTLLMTLNEIAAGTDGQPVSGPNATVGLNLLGVAPDLTLAYYLQTDQNVMPLPAGATLALSDVRSGTTATAILILGNRGSGPGRIRAISSQGADFQLSGLPLLPADLDAGREFRFNLRYSPKQNGTAAGKLNVDLDHTVVEIGLEGNAIGPVYAYQLIENEQAKTLSPGAPFDLGATNAGEVRNFLFEVKNTGNADGVIGAVNLLGPGFQLTDGPFLPTTIAPGSSVYFGLRFSPAQAGTAVGRLRIDAANFEFRTLTGGRLAFACIANGKTVTAVPNGTVTLDPVAVGATSDIVFEIANEGSAPATVSTIALNGSGFSLAGLPSFPAVIEPGARLAIGITFAPAGLGTVVGALRIDANQFAISVSGSRPPALPAVRFEGAGPSQQPMQQPAIGLALESTYPFTLHGVLSMAVEAGSTDAAVQFATGGRSVPFTIPANTAKAIFPNNQDSIRFQTGTLAGSITLSASFATAANFDLTPDSPPRLSIVIPASAPRLLDAQVVNESANSIEILLRGYTTTRELGKLDLEFTPAAGYRFPTARFSLALDGAAAVWFQSAASQGHGGLFSVSLTFSGSNSVSDGKPGLAELIQSIATTVSNSRGSSETVLITLP